MKKQVVDLTRILVVEDELVIRQMCRKVLASECYKVDFADNGKVAQGAIGRKKYDICLIDMKMPVMDGKQLFQWLKDKHPKLTEGVIFTSGDMLSPETDNFLKLGDNLFLPKPFTPDELKTALKNALIKLGKQNDPQSV